MFRFTCIVVAIITGLYGIGYLLVPIQVASLYLSEIDSGTLLLGRYFGVSLLFIAVTCWLIKDVADPAVRQVISTAGIVNGIAGLGVSVIFTLNGLMSVFGWSAVGIYLGAIVLWLLSRNSAVADSTVNA